MSGYSIDYPAGSLVFKPRRPRPGKYPVLLLHGMGGNARTFNVGANWRHSLYARRLAMAGFTMMSVSLGDGFGAPSETSDMEIMRVWASNNLPWCDPSKMVLLGISMGNMNAWGYRRDYPTRVAGILGIMGTGDINDARVRDPLAGVRTGIDAAWAAYGGSAYPAALPAAARLDTMTNTLKGIPSIGFYSTGDTVAPPQKVIDWQTAVGGTSVVAGAGTHGDAIMYDVDVTASKNFLYAAGA
jgi:pimeloyl-ACP methyl ester carboxylesterase